VTHEQLRGVLAPAAELAEVDGMTLMLLSVELWTTSVFLHLAVLRSAQTDELDATHQRAMDAWAAGPHTDDPPPQPGERLTRLPLMLADDAGTPYHPTHRHAGGTATEWRSGWKFEPGPPATTMRLTVTLDQDGQQRHHELELPPPQRP
jgi:hypothetical protein